ncbi:MAG: signal peptide peptidase SppA [Halioglobus sp.]
MKSFFARLGSVLTSIRIWTVNLFTLLVLVYVVGMIVFALRQLPGEQDPTGKVLILNPEGVVLDQEVYPSELEFPFSLPDEEQIQSRDLIKLIRAAAQDERLGGVLVDFSNTSFSGASTALNIAEELAALKASGKSVIAYSESLTTSSYLMAAQAQEIYVHPSGAVAISGLGGYRDYTRELTDKLKITIHNYSQGDYKSYVEGFTRTDMSDADREQRTALYGPIWSAMKNQMATPRELSPELFQDLADNHVIPLLTEAGYDNLTYATSNSIIDGTKTFPEFRDFMIEKFGKDESEDQERDTYPHISWSAYQAQMPVEEQTSEDSIAVVFVEGAIQTGEIAPGVAGSDDIAPLLRRAHESEKTRAIVMRVNSPGGSILGSDIIRDELEAASRKGLPIIVSMGDVAASGGVWVSTPADAIFAEPTTITGSIGVAVAFPTVENALDHIGIKLDGVTTSANAGWSIARPVDEKLDAIFARWASSSYQRFINVVAQSRDKEPDYIRSIAGGRVWLAPSALELGLIDQLGTMEDAIEFAATQAELEDYRVSYVVKPVSPAMAFLRRFSIATGKVGQSSFNLFAAKAASLMDTLVNISEPRATVMCTMCSVELL